MNDRQTKFQAELDSLPSWQEPARLIAERLRQTRESLATREAKLLELRPDFAELEKDFWQGFCRGLGCADPTRSLATARNQIRRTRYLGPSLAILFMLLVFWCHQNPLLLVLVAAVSVTIFAMIVVCPLVSLAEARKVSAILARVQKPIWLTGGSIGLSSLGTNYPAQAQWWWQDRIAFVFTSHLAADFSIDALTRQPLWENPPFSRPALTAKGAADILQSLLSADFRYRHLVLTFAHLVSLENVHKELEDLNAKAEAGLAEELRAVELRAAQGRPLPKVESESSSFKHSHFSNGNASWDTLVIPQSLRENLQAYCRILRDYKAYKELGVKLPKGLLLYGPPGCGKTQIAKTLATEGGLNFVALSTSECKAMWIGHSADRLAKAFQDARSKQPSLIFIDELDIVCPSRGLYNDCISQEFTGELLQQLDGIGSDADAIFLCGATNRPDQIDAAILSRFAEQIEIPLPDEIARRALLEVFLGPLGFSGKREQVILSLARATQGKSGRDLRALVNRAVLNAVKRTSSPQDFALSEQDFTLPQTSPSSTPDASSCEIETASDAVGRGHGRILPVSSDESEDEESTITIPNPASARIAPLLNLNTAGALTQALKEHAITLSGDDTRVKNQADGLFKGKQFISGDALHEHVLANIPEEERLILNAAQSAIANSAPMHMTYASASRERLTAEPPIFRTRQIEYEVSSRQARLLGQTRAELVGHSFIPTSIGVSLASKQGEMHQAYIQGISTNAVVNNWRQLNKALTEIGEQSPYPELNTPKFRNDLSGYVQNLLAGHRGAGNRYQVGTADYPANPDRKYVPYRLRQREGDFMNAIVNNTAARYNPKLRELARKGGTLLTEQGEVNPILQSIDQEHIHDPAIDRAAKQTWRTQILEPTIRTFTAGLIQAIHESPEHIPEEIRPTVPGYQELTQTLDRQLGGPKGCPDVPISVGF